MKTEKDWTLDSTSVCCEIVNVVENDEKLSGARAQDDR